MSTPAPHDPAARQVPYGFQSPIPPGQPDGYRPEYGYAPGYGPGYGYGRRPARNGLAITSLVLGILAVATSLLTLPGLILGIAAIVFGGIGLARANSDRVSNKGMAIAGLATGILGAVIGTLLLVYGIRIASDCQQQYGPQVTEDQLASCIEDQFGS